MSPHNKDARMTEAIIAIVVLLGGIWAAYRKGRKDETAKRDLGDAKGYTDTRKRIDETNLGDDPDVLRDFLRNRNPNKR